MKFYNNLKINTKLIMVMKISVKKIATINNNKKIKKKEKVKIRKNKRK